MALYTSDFQSSTMRAGIFDRIKDDLGDFSVIITNDIENDETVTPDSIITASKPLLYFSALFGLQMVRLGKNSVHKINVYNKIYSACVLAAIITLLTFVRPISWNDTRADIPLNILTIAFTLLHYAEVVYLILSVPFRNSDFYIKIFRTFDDLTYQLKVNSRVTFYKMRTMSVIFALTPLTQFICTFFLRKFYISNIGVHLTIFVILIQGSIIYYFVLNFHQAQQFFNKILATKTSKTIAIEDQQLETQDVECSYGFMRTIFSIRMNMKPQQRCWLELMQMYDKLADTVYIFNKIYSAQVLLMFTTWLACTLLTICRALSPSLNYSEIYLSDLFLYCCINSRPLFLGVMCELIVKEWRRTRDLLIHVMIHGNLDNAYFEQVQTMLGLVETRRLEVSANIFLVNIPSVTRFAGKAISYTVLMIQYFYMHISK